MSARLKDNDQTLWARFLNGNDQALSLIYLRHVNALLDYGCKITSNRDLVKDAIQDIFCTIIRNRQTLSATDNIRLYLFKALKRKLIREIQKSHRIQQVEGEPVVSFNISFLCSFDHTDFELSRTQKQELVDAIEALTDRQKEAIYLRFTRGLDYREIAVILNLNYQSARALIHRAISKLRVILADKAELFSQVLWVLFQSNRKPVF
ncbi:sigma-70 family RNA polymerase sigma factor [uncultured Sunxiuqinia sp.]|uniref:RNA polymerase sigma factor n=1 Tax=uncultured Sunxiuqinia sp. TaxID=1573825 RepID=UPI002638D79A|nr:sigma-70 family RNA polymerase sigma factor [uncultured Sunxiuqinia sp.]